MKFVSYSVFKYHHPTFILEAATVSGTFETLYIKGPNLRICLQALQYGASNTYIETNGKEIAKPKLL